MYIRGESEGGREKGEKNRRDRQFNVLALSHAAADLRESLLLIAKWVTRPRRVYDRSDAPSPMPGMEHGKLRKELQSPFIFATLYLTVCDKRVDL